MALEQEIMAAMKPAMIAKDEARLRGLRAIKSALLLERTSANASETTPETEIKMLQKLVKQRRESLEIFQKQNRSDLAEKELQEIEVIERFLPKQLNDDEVKTQMQQLITDTGATSIKDMGKLMAKASQHFAGRADASVIGRLAKELLNQNQ